jgi:hypothetical protein
MATRMQQRRGTAAQWTAANPILAAGEIGFETDTSKFKMGNGSSTWSALQYYANAAELAAIIDNAPGALDTLNELAAAIGDDANFVGTVTSHTTATTNVHGIASTSALATTAAVNTAIAISQTASSQDATTKANSAVAAAVDAIGVHNSYATNVHGIENTELLATKSYATTAANTAVSTHNSDTTNIHGIADTDALATKMYADAAEADAITAAGTAADSKIATHNADTTDVHGIPDTSLLATKLYADSAVTAEATNRQTAIATAVSSLTKSVVGLDQVNNTSDANKPVSTAQGTAISTAVSDHNSDITNVHGIADTSVLVTQTDLTNAINGAEVDQSLLAGTGLVWDSVDSELDLDPTHITTATQTALDLKSPLASPTFTGTVTTGHILPTTDNTFDLGSPTKMWKDIYVGPGSLYVNGQKVIQDESGAIVVSADVDENLGLRTSGSGNIELDPTGTGSVNIKGPLVVEAGANFSSADGNGIAFSNGIKSDSVASKTLNTDLSLSGNGTGKVYLNDNAEVNGNLVVGGNLTVSGTTTTVNSETIALADNIIDLNSNFTTGSPTENAGLRIMRGDSAAVQIRWNESTDKWEFTTDGTNYSVIAPTASPTFTGTVTIPAGASISGYAPTANPTFTGTVTVAANGVAFTDGTQTKTGVPSVTTIATALAAGARTLAAGEQDKFVPLAGAVLITLPATGYSTGQSIDFYQESGTGAKFESTNGVVGTPGLKFRTTNSVATALKTATGWLVFGDLAL